MSEKKLQVVRVILPGGREVLLHEIKISTTEYAIQRVASKANGDPMVLQLLAQKEIIKAILFKVDGHELTANQKEDLDGLFKYSEYSYLMRVVAVMTGGEEMGKEPIVLELIARPSSTSPKEA